MKKLLVFLAILVLGGCAYFPLGQTVPFNAVYTVAATDYYGAGTVFHRIKPSYYMKEKEIFTITSEQELALLLMKKSEAGETKVNYMSSVPLSLNKTFAYLESIDYQPFNLSSGYTEYTRNGKVVETVKFTEITPLTSPVAEVDAKVKAILAAQVQSTASITVEITRLHDYLVANTRYDTSISTLNLEKSKGHASFEAYGALLKGTAVCSGYAKAMMALSEPLRIPILYVASTVMQHAWNMVYDGSQWLYLDATWDDPIPDQAGRVLHTYFMETKSDFLRDGQHHFDISSDTTLSAADYLAFAQYVFPKTTN